MAKRKNYTDHRRMPIIPSFVHAIFDYILALALILIPQVFGFHGAEGRDVQLSLYLGILLLGANLLADQELGLVRILPGSVIRIVDGIAAIILFAAIFVLDLSGRVLVGFLSIGVCLVALAVFSESEPQILEHARPDRL